MDYCGYFGQNGLTEGVPFHLNGNFTAAAAAGYGTAAAAATGAPNANVYGSYANPYLTTNRLVKRGHSSSHSKPLRLTLIHSECTAFF